LTGRPPERGGRLMRDRPPRHPASGVLGSRAGVEGERKVVTVLFADIKSSTTLLARLDPEVARKALDRVLTLMIEGVHRYEGTVNQVLGDGIMALFGAPFAHEDHAVRACHAALAIRQSVQAVAPDLKEETGIGVDIRIGLNSGEVIVRAIDSDLHMHYSAVGLTTHLAARMEQVAAPNAVYMTDVTWRLVERHVEAQPLGPREVRGVTEPVVVWQLTATRSTRHDVEQGFESGSPFVGRTVEMSTLEQARECSLAGDVRVIGISGHPGVGKTRLSLEFVERCRRRGARVWSLRAAPHGQARPFSLVLEFIRQYFGIEGADRVANRRAIEQRVSALDANLDATPLVEVLEEVDVVRMTTGDSEFRRHALFEVIGKVVRLESARGFLVILLEDLHWLDAASEFFVEGLADALPGTRAMLVTNFRPPYVAAWMQRSFYQQIPLSPLGEPDASALVDSLVGMDPSLARIRRRLLARAQGNPFFLEELVKSLAGSGRLRGAPGAYLAGGDPVDDELPLTINAVLASRIDRLPSMAREVLRTASVIGNDFAHNVLEGVVEISPSELASALRTLLQGEFILRQTSADPGVFSFRHPLMQEVTYQSQVADRRARLHRRIAFVLKALHPDRLSELAALIAYHREAAGDLKAAAGYTTRAAMWVGLSDPRQAVAYWAHAGELLKRLPDEANLIDVRRLVSGQLLAMAWRVGMPLAEAREYYETSVTLAERVGDKRAHALALVSYGRVVSCRGSADDYVAIVQRALAMTREGTDRALLPVLHAVAGQAYRLAGFLGPALEATDEALREMPRAADLGALLVGFNVEAWTIGIQAQCLMWLGRFSPAREALDRMAEHVQTERDLSMRLMPCVTYAELAALEGDTRLARAQRRAADQLLEEGKSAYFQVYALSVGGLAELVDGSAASAVGAFQQALDIARTTGTALDFEPRILCDLSAAQLKAGCAGDALTTARAAVDLSRARANRIMLSMATLRAVTALAEVSISQRGEIADLLEQAEGLIRETGAVALSPLLAQCQQRAR
jgi:adenylate cyclase